MTVRDVAAQAGATDTIKAQAAITAAVSGDTILFSGTGTYNLDTLTVANKTNLTFSAPSCVLKRVAVPTNHLFRIGEAGPCTNLTFDIAEIDGNSFAGAGGTGSAFAVRNTTGFTYTGYIHHIWNHGFHFNFAPSSSVSITLRAEYIGVGYTADHSFVASTPNGCGVYFATAAPVTNGTVTVTGTDIKGFGAVYVAGCTGLELNVDVTRLGYRGVYCSGTGTITGLTIPDPQISECGAVYESSATPGASLYGQGTNGIYTGIAPTAGAQAVITGGVIDTCGENAVEGLCTVSGLTASNTGYRYTGFGTGLALEGIFPTSGSSVDDCTFTNPGNYGVHVWDTPEGLTDITVSNITITSPVVKGFYFQQVGPGTAERISIHDITIFQGSASPTYGLHVAGNTGGSLASTVVIDDIVTSGRFTTARVLVEATGGGTTSAVLTDSVALPSIDGFIE